MPRRLFRIFALVLILLCPWGGKSRTEEGPLQPRILLLVDGSSSMLQPWNNMSRFKAAGKIISAFIDSIYEVNPNVEFALRVYGHQSPAQNNDCFDSKLEVMFSKKNAVQMALRMNSIHPFGVSPIAYSLREAATNDLTDELHNAYAIILITDGGESCGGDICDVVKKLIEQKIIFRPYILGLVNYAPLKEQYACLGSYLQVTNEGEMKPAIQTIVDAYRPVLSVPIMPTRKIEAPVQRQPTAQEVPKPATVPAPEWTPDRSQSPFLPVLASKSLKSPAFRTPAPQKRPAPSSVGKIFFNAEPEVVVAMQPRTPESIARIQPKSTQRTINIPRFVPVAPARRSVSFVPPTYTVEPPVQRTAEQISTIPAKTIAAKFSAPAFQPLPPRKRSVSYVPPVFTIEPPEPRNPEVIASLQPRTTLRTSPMPAAVPVAPRKRSIQYVPPTFQIEPPEPVQIAQIPPKSAMHAVSTPSVAAIAPRKRSIQYVPPTFQIEPPEPVQITQITPKSAMRTVSTPTVAVVVPRKRSVSFTPPVFQKEPREPEQIAGIQPSLAMKPVRANTFHAMTPAKRSIPALPPMPRPEPEPVIAAAPPAPSKPAPDTARSSIVVKKLDAPPVTKPRESPKKPADNKPKEATFTTEREDDKETTLSILFTDGRGKFYATTPQLQLTDPKSGKIISQFYRTVDAAGNPDPQKVLPGQYNLVIAGRSNMLMRGLSVEKDKKNRIIVKVPQGSLRFRYEDAPDRPVTEFDAIATIRFEPGPTVRQKCTQELEYPPGNYYIEVNTMPISRFNTDIDFGAITEIQIPMPGFVQFTNRTPLGPISLYTPLGNKFVRFYGLQITGNQAAQRLQLKPGLYEVRWVKNPNVPYASETIEKFTVKSNSVTEVELR